MNKKWWWVVVGLVFGASYLISQQNTVLVNWDKLGQVVGLGALVAGYFGTKILRKLTVTEK